MYSPQIISHTIAYIVNIHKPSSTTTDTSCRSSPSSNSIRSSQAVTQQHPDNTTTTTTTYQPPQQHHNYLIEHLEGSIEQAHRLAGKTAFTSADLNELCKISLQRINRDRAQHQSTTSGLDKKINNHHNSSSYSNRCQQQQHIDMDMTECNNDIQREVAQHHLPDHRHHRQQVAQPPPGYTCHIVFDINGGPETYIYEPPRYQPSYDWHQQSYW